MSTRKSFVLMTASALVLVWILGAVAEARVAPGQLVVEPIEVTSAAASTERVTTLLADEGIEEKATLIADRRQRIRSEKAAVGFNAADPVQRPRFDHSSRAGDRRSIEDLVPDRFRDLVNKVANEFGLDPRMVAAVGTVESNWHEQELGTHGDTGLMQILPATGQWIAENLSLQSYTLSDPYTNLRMGAWYLSFLMHKWGNWTQALAEYNGGPAAGEQAAVKQNLYATRVIQVYQS